MTDTIPDDVMKAAREVATEVGQETLFGDYFGMHHDEAALIIARAILAERKRCAKIAIGMADAFDVSALRAKTEEDIVAKRSAEGSALAIAAAIQSGKE